MDGRSDQQHRCAVFSFCRHLEQKAFSATFLRCGDRRRSVDGLLRYARISGVFELVSSHGEQVF
jgi:hypothetical protein